MTILLVSNPGRYGFSRKAIPEVNSTVKRDRERKSVPELGWTTTPIYQPLGDWNCMKYFVPGALMGTWIGIWFFQIAQQYADTAVVTTLVSTCPIFAIPLVCFVQKHTVSSKGILGTIVAVGGIILVVFYSD